MGGLSGGKGTFRIKMFNVKLDGLFYEYHDFNLGRLIADALTKKIHAGSSRLK